MENRPTKIISEIMSFVSSHKGTVVQDFYAGVAASPEKKLFSEHRIDPHSDSYIYFRTSSSASLKKIKEELMASDINLDKTETSTGDYVYCYLISDHTKEK